MDWINEYMQVNMLELFVPFITAKSSDIAALSLLVEM
jgi:hypothetical protein